MSWMGLVGMGRNDWLRGFCVEAVRGASNSFGTRSLNGVTGSGKCVFNHATFIRGKFSEHVANEFPRDATADADFEARENIGAEVLKNGFDAIVPSGGSFFTETEHAQRKGNIIIDDKHVRARPLVE